MELEWQGSVQEDGHRQQKHRTSPQSPPQPGCRGPPFHPASRTVRAGRKCGPGPLHVLAPDHEHFPQPSGTRPHFVFTHNQFLIKFDFSSHLFRSRSPLDMASTKAGTGWQEGKQTEQSPSIGLFWEGNRAQDGLLPGELFSPKGHCSGRLASQASGIWIGPSQEPR